MIFRLLIMVVLLSACRSAEMACPEVKAVKLNKRPSNYMRSYSRSLSASANDRVSIHEKNEIPQQTRVVKSSDSIEEWDCPKPGTKAAMPRSVKENIRKNRKKFDAYYKSRSLTDSIQSAPVLQPK
jgi:hypothetical protein